MGWFLNGKAIGEEPLLFKEQFKIGFFFGCGEKRGAGAQDGMVLHMFACGGGIIQIVCGKMEFSCGLQFACGQIEKGGLDQAPVLMSALGPGVRVEDVEGLDGIVGYEMFQEKRNFGPYEAGVLAVQSGGFSGYFAGAFLLPLDPDEIDMGVCLRAGEDKSAFAATGIDFERIRVAKESFRTPVW